MSGTSDPWEIEEFELDERSENMQMRFPHPEPFPQFGPDPAAGPQPSHLETDGRAGHKVVVANRALFGSGKRLEGVPDCAVVIGTVQATTNAHGNATLDLSALTDGHHGLSVTPSPAQMQDGPPGPGLPTDPNVERIWDTFLGSVELAGGRVVAADPPEWIDYLVHGHIRIGLKPKWMRCRGFEKRPHPIDTIVIHHTGDTNPGKDAYWFLYGGVVSVHYLVAPDGGIYKMIAEDKLAWHAGRSYWLGREELNASSIGIEMTHATGDEYQGAQVDATVALVERLLEAHPEIPRERVVGHSDVALNARNKRPPTLHGRKSTDPGSAFPWERLEAKGIGLIAKAETPDPQIYGGYFALVSDGVLHRGDNDATHTYGGERLPSVSGAVEELQRDLSEIGYYCEPFDGIFGLITARALQMFEQHYYSGSRRTGPDPWNSGDGRLEWRTAELIKSVKINVVGTSIA
ncbi:N-acetylmuramoyl-L-alanine amidase [Roseovarius aestuarii]|uniref:N-acetylmuramoyl-L-alanine amidase n=1 Tax=Roseovarius aestuarii TaxID=475083 RepID=A0A1X7BXK7_9RHOB|nr:N-acetylmuramoyl-L-alanine amidase [Roseovarius aestuarii]SMC13999.1 1,6-anhydro-N-acetylmuramyl-L-alanine amidase AmpD [Roseovarius aestuarii]